MTDVVSIVGGGWSFTQVDRSTIPGFKLGVNDAGWRADLDASVSMDRLWTEGRWPELVKMRKPAFIRRAATKGMRTKYAGWCEPDWLTVYDCNHLETVLSDRPGWLNGTNSGLFALNRAYQVRPKLILLYAFDMQPGPKGEPYWYEPYPWAGKGTKPSKYSNWAKQYEDAARQCKSVGIHVVNCNTRSLIKAFPVIDHRSPLELRMILGSHT